MERLTLNRNETENRATSSSVPFKQMKVVLLVRTLAYGGLERQLVELAKGMHGRGVDVTVLVFYRKAKISFADDLLATGVATHYLDKKGRLDILGFIFRAIRFLRRESPDILYGFAATGSNIMGCLMKLFMPHMKVVWSVQNSMTEQTRANWLTRIFYQLEVLLSGWSDLIISNSRAGLEHSLSRGFPKERMMVIPNGFDIDRFRPNPDARKAVRKEWGCENGTKVVGIVGRHHPVKDHPTFLRAAAYLIEKCPNVKFVCIGGKHNVHPEYHDAIIKLTSEMKLHERLTWVGPRGDMPAVYNAMDILCSSSFSEGLSNVIGEAMACGVPCVVTDVGDSARVVGDWGVVVPPREPKALARGLVEMIGRLEKEKDEISRQVRRRIVENFSHDPLIDNTIQALRGLV